MKRIFVAIGLSTSAVAAIAAWRQPYESWPVRWISDQNLHITLIPPWSTEYAGGVIDQLQSISGKLESFALRLEEVALGPVAQHPTLIWATGAASEPLLDLKEYVETTVQQMVSRKFQPHLTLARLKERDVVKIPADALPQRVLWLLPVNNLVLFESHLRPDGAEYEALARLPL